MTSKYLKFIAEPINQQLKNSISKMSVFKSQGQRQINKISFFRRNCLKVEKKKEKIKNYENEYDFQS